MIHGTGSSLSITQIQMIRLTAERESGRDSKLSHKESARRNRELRQEKLRVEAEKMVAEIEAATSANPFSNFLGKVAGAAIGALDSIAKTVGDLVPLPVAGILAGTFVGQLLPAAQAILGAAAGLAPHAVSAALTTNLITRVVDDIANLFVVHGAKADLADATIELDGVQGEVSRATAEREELRADRDTARASARRLKQQVQKEIGNEAERKQAWLSPGAPIVAAPNGGAAVAQAQAVQVEAATQAESDLVHDAKAAQRRAANLQQESAALRGEATRDQHASEVAGAWIAIGQLGLEILGLAVTFGASAVVTASASAANATINAASGGLGLAGQLFDDEDARRKLRQAESIDVEVAAAEREAEQARSEAKTTRVEIEATLDSADEMLEAQKTAGTMSGGSAAQVRAVQTKRGTLEMADARDSLRTAHEHAERAVAHRHGAIDQRRVADGEQATDNDWKLVFSVAQTALSAATSLVGAELPDSVVNKVLSAASSVSVAGGEGRSALDQTHGAEETRRATEEDRRAELTLRSADEQLRDVRRANERRRTMLDTALKIQRDLGPVRA